MSAEASARDAIQSLYRLYANHVYRYAWAMLGDSFQAYDAVQEVFLRAYQSWGQFRREASAKTWIMTLARNHVIDVLRKRRTEKKYVSSRELLDIGDPAPPMDLMVEVAASLHQLNPSYRQVVILRYVENFSVPETAAILGWSEKKVRNSTHRAMVKLRDLLGGTSKEVHR